VTVGEAAGNAVFTVTLSAISGKTVSVPWTAANGTAQGVQDYSAGGGTLTFNPGQTTQTITVSINNDTLDEIDENYFINLGTPTNATIADGQGEGTITDNDDPPSITIGNNYAFENIDANAAFQVTLSAASGKTVSVTYATANG